MSHGAAERGSSPVEFVLAAGLLVLPVALMVLIFPTWLQRQNAGRVAAQEAARAAARSADWAGGVAAGQALARTVAANHGLAPSDLTLQLTGDLRRGSAVTAAVTVEVPVTVFPGLTSLPALRWTAAHTERVGLYRSAARPGRDQPP